MVKRIWTLFKARNIEFHRDRSALGWSLLFPFLIIAGFSLIFSDNPQKLYKTGILQSKTQANLPESAHLISHPLVHAILVSNLESALVKLRHHQLDMVLSPDTGRYWINSDSPRGTVLEEILLRGACQSLGPFTKQVVEGDRIPYVEWLFPGILGMNMMFSALFGVGYVVVRYRKNGVLKRLSVTPVRPWEFLTAQILSRLFVMLATTGIVYGTCSVLYGFSCRGSLLALFTVFLAGGMSMISLGLLLAARGSSEELAGGILNLISWPMMFLSGVWFSLEGTSPWVQTVSRVFPLTHLIEGARKVMNDGAGFPEIQAELAILFAMALASLVTGALLFQWRKD
jgi:ABC-type multidrug transport system permease subunit